MRTFTTAPPGNEKGRPSANSETAQNFHISRINDTSAAHARVLISLVAQTRLQPVEAEIILERVAAYANARVVEAGGGA